MKFSSKATLSALLALAPTMLVSAQAQQIVTGQAAFADWNQEQPGVRRKITLADLPEPKPRGSCQQFLRT